jgi:hypothetical protein
MYIAFSSSIKKMSSEPPSSSSDCTLNETSHHHVENYNCGVVVVGMYKEMRVRESVSQNWRRGSEEGSGLGWRWTS